MEKSVIEKKFKKLGTKELEAKLKRNTLSLPEVEVVKSILEKRKGGETYVSPTFAEESKEVVKKITEQQEKEPIKEVKSKTEKKTVTSRSKLSSEDSEAIKKIVDKFEGSKKELIFHLFEKGFTKQQLDKYQPQIAHWSYIYSLSDSLKSDF